MNTKKRVFEPFEHWTVEFCQGVGFFNHLQQLFGFDQWQEFPSAAQLIKLLHDGTTTYNGQSLQFVGQDDVDFAGRAYETVIYQTGQVPTRYNNWHDLFGAFIWCVFPKTKALLNHLHHSDIQQHGQKVRTKTRNAITLLDECGVILAVTDAMFKTKLREHQWHWAFVEQRQRWGQDVLPFIIGHANYEMLTKPYIGLTGKALFVTVEANFATLSLLEQYQFLDERLSHSIQDEQILMDNSHLSPLPLLGVPGWYEDNKDPVFYDNKQYFRDKRAIK